MIAEAIKAIRELADLAAAPKVLDLPDPRARSFIVNGEIRECALPEPPRAHSLGRLDDLITLANRFAGKGEDGESAELNGDGNPPKVVVWYDAEKVVAVLDDAGHRVETATLSLKQSDAFRRVCGLRANPSWMEQKDFIRLLRIDLAGTLDPVHLLNVVRKVRFENGVATTSEARHARESLGRTIAAAASGEGEIPEEVTLELPVYSTPGLSFRLALRCAVEVDPARGAFRLVPLPDEIDWVSQRAVETIGGMLREGLEEGVPAYWGRA